MGRNRRPYAPEFRREIVELLRLGRSPGSLAREFEPTAQSIRTLGQASRSAPFEATEIECRLRALRPFNCDHPFSGVVFRDTCFLGLILQPP